MNEGGREGTREGVRKEGGREGGEKGRKKIYRERGKGKRYQIKRRGDSREGGRGGGGEGGRVITSVTDGVGNVTREGDSLLFSCHGNAAIGAAPRHSAEDS